MDQDSFEYYLQVANDFNIYLLTQSFHFNRVHKRIYVEHTFLVGIQLSLKQSWSFHFHDTPETDWHLNVNMFMYHKIRCTTPTVKMKNCLKAIEKVKLPYRQAYTVNNQEPYAGLTLTIARALVQLWPSLYAN